MKEIKIKKTEIKRERRRKSDIEREIRSVIFTDKFLLVSAPWILWAMYE